ncbi:hypothetical protein KVMX100_110122 [Klebsiella variicola]|nr:hypothetical protein KVMX100_110122 [Klebsiella variicola]
MLVAVQEDGTTTNEWLYQAFPCRDMHEQVSQLGILSTSPLKEWTLPCFRGHSSPL